MKWRKIDKKPEDAVIKCNDTHVHRGSRGSRHLFWVSDVVLPLADEVILRKSHNLPGMMRVDLKGFNIGNSIL